MTKRSKGKSDAGLNCSSLFVVGLFVKKYIVRCVMLYLDDDVFEELDSFEDDCLASIRVRTKILADAS